MNGSICSYLGLGFSMILNHSNRMLIRNVIGIVILAAGMFMTAAAEDDASRLREAEHKVESLTMENDKLREFAKQGLIGRRYDELKAKNGETYESAVVMDISGTTVELNYMNDGKRDLIKIEMEDGLPEWSVLLPSDPSAATPNKTSGGAGKIVRPGEDIGEAIVVIEGDAGVGTGFMVEDEGKTYL